MRRRTKPEAAGRRRLAVQARPRDPGHDSAAPGLRVLYSTVQDSNRATLGMSIACIVRHGRLSGNVGLQANPEHVCVQLNMHERSGYDSLAPV